MARVLALIAEGPLERAIARGFGRREPSRPTKADLASSTRTLDRNYHRRGLAGLASLVSRDAAQSIFLNGYPHPQEDRSQDRMPLGSRRTRAVKTE